MNKIPLEFVTTLSQATNGSPVVWDGNSLTVATRSDWNLAIIVQNLTAISQNFANFVASHEQNLQSIPQLASQVLQLAPALESNARALQTVLQEQSQLSRNLSIVYSKLSPLDVRISSLSNSVTSFRATSQEALSSMVNLDARLKTLESAGGLVSRVSILESNFGEVERRISPIETSLSTMRSESASFNSRLASLEGKVASMEASITSLLSR